MVILPKSHGTITKSLSHCVFSLMVQLGKPRAKKRVLARGFAAMISCQNREEVLLVEACGPLQTAEGGEHNVGAIRATNNTAEMQALIEALFWLNSCVEQKGLPSSSKVVITIDSLHVKGLIDEKFVARKNRALAILHCHMWKVTMKKLQLQTTLGTGTHW